jgi:hypothetical protein
VAGHTELAAVLQWQRRSSRRGAVQLHRHCQWQPEAGSRLRQAQTAAAAVVDRRASDRDSLWLRGAPHEPRVRRVRIPLQDINIPFGI